MARKTMPRHDLHLRLPAHGYQALKDFAEESGVSVNVAAWLLLRHALGLVLGGDETSGVATPKRSPLPGPGDHSTDSASRGKSGRQASRASPPA